FLDGSTLIGSAAVSGGSASLSTASLSVGPHSITASYAGDANFNGSASTPLAEVVNQESSATTISSSVDTSTYGKKNTIIATMTPSTATGAVEFFDGTTSLGSTAISSGAAALSIASLSGGSHSITAVYSGDLNLGASVSAPLTQTVNKASTTTTISS